MPVKKIIKKKSPTPSASKKKTIEKLELCLPTERNVPSEDFEDYSMLLYGFTKIGKTSLISHFPDTLNFMFEPGSKALKTFQVNIPTWDYFREYINLLEKGNHSFKRVCIDTGGIAYDRCLEYVCRINGIQHPGGQDDYGASWNKIITEFERQHARLFGMGLGVIVIAHERILEIETRSGDKFNKIMPNFGKQAGTYYSGIFDDIFFYDYEGKERYLHVRGSDYIDAGTRCEDNFFTPEGERIDRIPMGNSSAESYANLRIAFNNEQKNPHKRKEIAEEEESETKPTVKKIIKKRK